MSTPLLEITDLNVHYGGVHALRDFSLTMQAGELVMLTGPNGAGKSTLMKALAGWVKPKSGAIRLEGQVLPTFAPEKIALCGLSLVPEGRQVFAAMTVQENLRVGLAARPVAARGKAAVAEDLDYVLEVFPLLRERLEGQAGLLSGGQQQMLVIARGLMARPRLLLIDEPSLGLAPRMTDQVYEALARLRQERRLTLLIVEQSAIRAVSAASRLLMLREGRVVLAGEPRRFSPAQLQEAYFGLTTASPA